jgi:dTDP-4-dehydrorhamnose reductase
MKIAVIGGDGQLGRDVTVAFEKEGDLVHSLTHQDIELSSRDSVANALKPLAPQVIVNTAAMHHVENCEKNPEQAYAVNGVGARNLAALANELGAVLVHLSTDYVFDGKKHSPYVEEDAPLPLNVYGNSKVAGEYFVRTAAKKHFVVRTSAIYGKNPCRAKGGLNFVELMLKLSRERSELRVVDSEFVSPTPTTDIAKQIVKLSRSDGYGLYHATSEGSCSWYEFASEIFKRTNTKINLQVAGPNEFPAKVPRPLYSVLENKALKARGLSVFRSWQEGLNDYLAEREGNKGEAAGGRSQ